MIRFVPILVALALLAACSEGRCYRHSDCDVTETCFKGECTPEDQNSAESSSISTSSSTGSGAAQTCEECVLAANADACSATLEACEEHAGCAIALACLQACTDAPCRDACVLAADPIAANLLVGAYKCAICGVCAEECGAAEDPVCTMASAW